MMKYGITVFAAVAMRKDPSEQSEMVSQLLFGEMYRILAEQEHWIRISTCYDHYEGWISKRQHDPLKEVEYRHIKRLPCPVLPDSFAEVIQDDAPAFTIIAGSDLPGYCGNKQNMKIKNRTIKIHGYSGGKRECNKESILKTSGQFLHTPYLWGGRSFFGCDCSGFVQTVFKIHNMFLPRDAAQQSLCGTAVVSLQDSEPCDLAFFKNEKQRVHHVGILISPVEIIHCSGCVRIDPIDDKGIFDTLDQQYTHHSFFIRRIVL